VLVVGMDGLNWAKVVDANAPTLDALAAGGTLGESLLYCNPVANSSSGPGWSTIATGVMPDKHGVKDNTFSGKQYGTYRSYGLCMCCSCAVACSGRCWARWSPAFAAVCGGAHRVRGPGTPGRGPSRPKGPGEAWALRCPRRSLWSSRGGGVRRLIRCPRARLPIAMAAPS
jgi:hypothetical protein